MVLSGTIDGRLCLTGRRLPCDRISLIGALKGAAIGVTLAPRTGAPNRENLGREATDKAVRVSCRT